MRKILISLLFLSLFFTCSTPIYTYTFDAGKYLDFGQGKWVLNDTRSNSGIMDGELQSLSERQFREILGDSLVGIHELRMYRLIPPEIGFELTREELIDLGKATGCDYLINISGRVINSGAGSLSNPTNDYTYYAANESSVSIWIHDLNSGILLSTSQVRSILTDQGSHFDNKDKFPVLIMDSHSAMLSGARKLIKKYGKYRVD